MYASERVRRVKIPSDPYTRTLQNMNITVRERDSLNCKEMVNRVERVISEGSPRGGLTRADHESKVTDKNNYFLVLAASFYFIKNESGISLI